MAAKKAVKAASQTAIEKLKAWIMTYPGMADIPDFRVDFTNDVPNNAGLFPSGMSEVSRKTDIFGNVFEVTNQYNFALYLIFAKAPEDAAGAAVNAEWIAAFQEWVQEEDIKGNVPQFGDDKARETIKAQDGVLYDATDEGIGTYLVQISVNYIKRF